MTMDATAKMSWLHDRMPLLLRDDAAVDAWLARPPFSITAACSLLRDLCPAHTWPRPHPHARGIAPAPAQSADGREPAARALFALATPAASPPIAAHPVSRKMTQFEITGPECTVEAKREVRARAQGVALQCRDCLCPVMAPH